MNVIDDLVIWLLLRNCHKFMELQPRYRAKQKTCHTKSSEKVSNCNTFCLFLFSFVIKKKHNTFNKYHRSLCFTILYPYPPMQLRSSWIELKTNKLLLMWRDLNKNQDPNRTIIDKHYKLTMCTFLQINFFFFVYIIHIYRGVDKIYVWILWSNYFDRIFVYRTFFFRFFFFVG